jgi:hypothetical protein
MRIIARMNVGGPAVQVSGLMRGLQATEFDHRLYTGFCDGLELGDNSKGAIIRIGVYVCMCVCMYVKSTCVCVYTFMHVCVYVCMHVCM